MADDFDPAQYLPAGCDLVELTRDQIQRALDRGADPHVTSLMIGRVDGTKITHLGTFAAAGATRAQLAASFGAGVYEIRFKNASGSYLGANRAAVDANGVCVGPPPMPGALGAGLPPAFTGYPQVGAAPYGVRHQLTPLEQLLWPMMQQRLMGQQDDPMRGAMAEIAKLTALQSTNMIAQMQATQHQQTQFLDTLAKMQLLSNPGGKDDKAFELMSKLILAERAKPAPATPVQEFLEAVKLGMAMASGTNAIKTEDGQEDSWIKLIGPAFDSLGPGTISLLAQALLPPEKAKYVDQTLQAHMKAREAEAKADAAIDTEGEAAP